MQETVARLNRLSGVAEPFLVCNEEHRFAVAEQLRLLGMHGQILLEPCGRNTAPAMALAALWARREGKDPILVVMPADHVILEEMCSGRRWRVRLNWPSRDLQ